MSAEFSPTAVPMVSPVVAWLLEGWMENIPPWLAVAFAVFFTFVLIVVPMSGFMSWIERKLGADFQARVGPNRAGPAGIMQPLADFLKLLQKKKTATSDDNLERPETIGWWIHAAVLFSTLAVLPLGSMVLIFDADMSALIPFWIGLLSALGVALIGLSRTMVPSWWGGLRIFAQALTGAFPALVCLLAVGIHGHGFRWSALVDIQGASPFRWTAVSDPFLFLGLIIYIISGLMLFGIPPMDSAGSSWDLHGGVSAGMSGPRLLLLRLCRFYGFFLWMLTAVVLFLGAWKLPVFAISLFHETHRWMGQQLTELALLLTKTIALMMGIVWLSRVNPRTRVDQLTDFSWTVLSPLALVCLIGTTAWTWWRALG